MTFFFDNNLSPRIVAGMKAFGEDVTHLTEHFAANTLDADWFEFIAEREMVLITKDRKIRWNPAEREAVRRHKIGAFFLGGKDLGYWRIVVQVVRNWEKIKDHVQRTPRPFAFLMRAKGTKFTRLSI